MKVQGVVSGERRAVGRTRRRGGQPPLASPLVVHAALPPTTTGIHSCHCAVHAPPVTKPTGWHPSTRSRPHLPPTPPCHAEVNMPWEKSWGATNGKGVLKYPFPPTVFYMMKRDLQVGAALRCGVPRCCAQRSATCRQAGCPSDGRQARACVCSGSCSPLPRRAQCLMRTASCVPPPPPPPLPPCPPADQDADREGR